MSTTRKLFISSGLLIAIRLFQRSLGLVSTLILARLLTPKDFGIVAVAALIVYFAEVLSNSGIQQYLVQVDEVSDDVVNTAWTLDIVLKFSICLLLFLSLPAVYYFYNDTNILYAVGALIPIIGIRALANPDLHLHRRELEYEIIFKIGVIQKIISFSVVIIIALQTRSFWAMIVGDLVSSVIGVVLSYYYCSRRPSISWVNISDQWNFSRWMLARGSIGYLRAQIDTLMVSQFYTLSMLGKFNIAREFTILPANEVIKPAVEPLLATFSIARNNIKELSKQVSMTLLLISCFTAPFVAFFFFFNKPVVLHLLGRQWLEAAPLMQAMTPLLFAFSIGGILVNLCLALKRLKIVFWYDVFSLAIVFVVLFLAREFTLENFIWLRSVSALTTVLVFLYICSRFTGTNYLKQVVLMITPLVISFSLSGGLYLINLGDSLFMLIINSSLFFMIYFVLIILVSRMLEKRSQLWAYIYEYSKLILNKFWSVIKRCH